MDARIVPLVLVLLAAPATAQEDATVEVTMHSEGSTYWFECVGVACNEGRNPPLVLDPGRTYTFHVVNDDDRTHDFRLDDLGATRLLDPGEEENLTVTVPVDAEGEGVYWCSVHRSLGMEGLVVYETEAVGGGPIDNDSPGPGGLLLAVALGAAMLVADRVRWRHAPASRRKP